MSLQKLNHLDDDTKRSAYASILPHRVFDHLTRVDPDRFPTPEINPETFYLDARPGSYEARLRVPAHRIDGDYALSLDLADAGGGQLEIGFMVINDLTARRYNTDTDVDGRMTLLGTAGRNRAEEIAALKAGLGPSQVRKGLGLFAELLPLLETLGKKLGYYGIVLEPLTYHNAVWYENHGFAYISGRKRMLEIDRAFAPGGTLYHALDGSPFRQQRFARRPRGRSWAIHDGILSHLDNDERMHLEMVKVIGTTTHQETFLTTWNASDG
ncbi:hypothetical protein [Mucisphaera calidilacus]|uniref:Uncharacterized protein n=1 Tax=Mucisphaera calidilacus TaxID=2527982 RepID=A0A518BY58_9BACT|nr:hypothetical protein [Mucisphaera calidilacus]QDU71910.1 hypothetical protein Pan265_17690 [Mucisphaera calidilacus]